MEVAEESMSSSISSSTSSSPLDTSELKEDSLQKVNSFIQHLPNYERVKLNASQAFEEIKQNLTKSVLYNELRPGLMHWTKRLLSFWEDYGLFFSKSEHIYLIKLYLKIIQTPHVDLLVVDTSLLVLSVLLSKFGKLSRKDLIIEWRPLFDLYLRIEKSMNDFNTTVFMPVELDTSTFIEFIKYARIYFDINSTQEMLDEWRPMLCPFSTAITDAFKRFDIFLPTIMYDYEYEYGFKLWINEFLDIWTTLSVFYDWESNLISLFARVAENTIGEFDWNPYIPFIFSNLLRGFGLPCGTKQNPHNTLNVVYTDETVECVAKWIVSLINNHSNDLCMQHIASLFHALRSFYHPSNNGSWSKNIFLFLKYLPKYLVERIAKEKITELKWYHNPKASFYAIKDEDTSRFVLALKEVTFTAIFNDSHHLTARKAFQYLTFLRSDIMLPSFIEKLNESISSLIHSDRYTKLLSCAVPIARELATYNTSNQLQIYVIPLLTAILPGIDPNDSNKSQLTFEFIDALVSSIIVCDCTPALHLRHDLSEYDKELIYQTAKFEDLIHELLNKIFNYMDNLSFSEAEESSEAAALASKSYSIDNDTHRVLIQVFQSLIRQSSKAILKVILNKIKLYITGTNFNIKCGKIVSIMCSYLVTSEIGELAFSNFFECVYDSLKKFKHDQIHYENFMNNERCNYEVTWNFQLLSQLVKLNGKYLINHMNQINEIFSWFRNALNLDAFNYVGFTFENLLTNLASIAPAELCSVNYSIIFDDETQFFKQHLPIREWGCRGDIKALNLAYHKPGVNELSAAVKFLNSELDKSIEYLTVSILQNERETNQISNREKKERLREITYIYFLLLGGSQLLKRSANKQLVFDHIDTNVEIGYKDNEDKGLGFELANMFNNQHEYSFLSSNDRMIMLNKREHLIELVIKLITKLIAQQTSEVSFLNICSAVLSLASIQYGPIFNSYENIWQKKYYNNLLYGKRVFTREELIQKVMVKYKVRSLGLYTQLNETDIHIIDTLFKLSIDSIYSSVRERAQKYLFVMFSHYSYSSRVIVPKLIDLLKRKHKLTHDQLKGCLYLIIGDTNGKSLAVKEDWQILSQLWPLLFKLQQFEKPSIQYLLDTIHLNICDNFESFDNRIRLDEGLVSLAREINPNDEHRLDWFKRKCSSENKAMSSLMNAMIRLADDLSINQPNLIYNLVGMMLNSCDYTRELLTEKLVDFLVDSLVNADLQVREVGGVLLCKMLKFTKLPKEKITYEISELVPNRVRELKPGLRSDNQWHLYEPDFLENLLELSREDNEKWSESVFLDKPYYGYYCWPSRLELKSNKPRVQNDFVMKRIELKFVYDQEFWSKLIDLSLIEESKGDEQFDATMFYLFKSLLRNYGSAEIVPNFYQHLIELITNRDKVTQERSHKLAAEMIAGLVRGSKNWPLDKLKEMWSNLKQIFELIIDNLSNENSGLWEVCFNMLFKDQDPRRMTFYLNFINDLCKKLLTTDQANSSSFKQSSALKLLFCALTQFEWRVPKLINNLFQLLLDNMVHPSLLVRQINAICLRSSTTKEIDFSRSLIKISNSSAKVKPRTKITDFIDHVEANMNKSIELFEDRMAAASLSDKQLEAISFLQSFFDWLISYMTSSYQPINQDLIRIIPQICKIDQIAAQDATLTSRLTAARVFLSTWILDIDSCDYFLHQLKQVLEYTDWRSRLAAVQMIQNIGTFNIFLITNVIRNEIVDLLITSLCDEQLEVRLSASNTLSGFIHSNLILVNNDLINKFKDFCKFKVKKRDNTGRFRVDSKNLIKKHGGILGLCSIVSAYPYEVPDFLPDCITYLCEFINDTNPIQESVRKCLNEFRRTHRDNWQENKLKFSESQLLTLADILISPSYYA